MPGYESRNILYESRNILRLHAPITGPPGRRCHSGRLSEHRAEICDVIYAAAQGYVTDKNVCGVEQLLGERDADAADIFCGGKTGYCLDFPVELDSRDAEGIGNRVMIEFSRFEAVVDYIRKFIDELTAGIRNPAQIPGSIIDVGAPLLLKQTPLL